MSIGALVNVNNLCFESTDRREVLSSRKAYTTQLLTRLTLDNLEIACAQCV